MARHINTLPCSVENCGKRVYAKGMCRPHWWRVKAYGRTHKIVARGEHAVCTIEGCETTKIKGHGFCAFHYRQYHTKYKPYNIDHNGYNELQWIQSGLCAICKQKETNLFRRVPGKIKKLAIDHDHKTGKVRGLLCNRCNNVLGRIEENIEILQAMINYLNKYKE